MDLIIEKCRGNDRRAQMELYNRYSEGMFIVALRFLKDPYEAEDAVQEAFIKTFQKLHQYNGEVAFGAWLKRIVINKCLDSLRSKKMELVALNEHIITKVEEEEHWQIEDGISLEQVKQCMDSLPERYKYPLILYLREGYDHQEISEILSITQVSSRTLIHRGKLKLQDELKKLKNGTGYQGTL